MNFDKENRSKAERCINISQSSPNSHLRDSSVDTAQEQWNRSMKEKKGPFSDTDTICKEKALNRETSPNKNNAIISDSKNIISPKSLEDGLSYSFTKSNQGKSEKTEAFVGGTERASTPMHQASTWENKKIQKEDVKASLFTEKKMPSNKTVDIPIQYTDNLFFDKEFDNKNQQSQIDAILPENTADTEKNHLVPKSSCNDSIHKSHLRDSSIEEAQNIWKQKMAGNTQISTEPYFPEKNTGTKRDSDYHQNLKEEQNPYIKSKKIYQKEKSFYDDKNIKKKIMESNSFNKRTDEFDSESRDIKKKNDKISESHLRESVMQTEQNLWKDKMQKKKESFPQNSTHPKERTISTASEEDKKVDEGDSKKRVAVSSTKDKKSKKTSQARVKTEEWDESKEDSTTIDELIKQRNEVQEKALDVPNAYTHEKIRRFSTNSISKILKKQKQILENGKDFLWRSSTAQTDTGRGIKEGADNIKPFIDMAIDTTKRSLASSIMGDMTNDKKFQEAYEAFKKKFNAIEEYKFKIDGKNVLGSQKYKNLIHVDPTKVMTRQEWKILQNDIRKILRDRGFGDFSANPILMKLQIAKAIRAGKFTEEEAKILKALSGRIAEISSLSGRSNIYHMMRFARRKLHKYGRQESTMNAIFLTKAFVQHVASTVKNALSVVKTAAFLTKNAAKLASLAAAKASAKISETKLAKKVADKLPDGVKATHSEIKKQRTKFKDAKKKVERKKNRIRDSIDVIVDKVPHPVKAVKMKFERAKSEVFGFITRGKYNPLRYIAKAFSITQQAKTVMICAIAGFFLFYVIVVALILIIAAMTGQYTMETNETKTNEYCLKKIEQLYQEQQNSLAAYDFGGAYRNVTINNVDKKSNPIYDEGLDFEETTNTAEMMSMAQVYFDFELDDAKQETVEAYLTGLYYGSHTTDIKETKHYTKDEDGNKVLDYIDADITVTTYYFDDLFDCALTSSGMFGSESAMAGQAFDIPQTFNQMWTVTKYDAINWGYDCGKLYNAWKAAGSQWDDGFACLNINGKSYRFIAVLEKFGKVGDYMTVQLDNGTNINCIVADTKRASECPNGWGHAEGNTVSVVEWEVSTDYFNRYGNPGSGYGKELHGRKAAKLINGGSYFKNPGGPSFTSSPVLDSSTGLTSNANTFFTLLNKYSDFIKQNSIYVRYGNSNNVKTYAQAKSNAEDHEKSTINCVSPIMWGLKEMGLLRKSTNFYSTTSGTWMGKGDSLTEKTTIISSGEPIGMNVITAAKKGLLKPGDIIANKSFNHTYVYVSYDEANQNIVVYEAGGNARNQGYSKVGCGPFSDKQYKNLKIASIIRWR